MGENRVFAEKSGPTRARLWPPHFLQWEGAVIRHSVPGSGTIAQSGSWLLTPPHGLLIRLTFRDPEELRHYCHTTVWSTAILSVDHEIKGKRKVNYELHEADTPCICSHNLFKFFFSVMHSLIIYILHALYARWWGKRHTQLNNPVGLVGHWGKRTWANLFS